jgi:putative phosphoesterase
MKIVVLSDIHGNLPALEAIINEIANTNIDHVIFLGDLITDFPQYTRKILQIVKTTSNHVVRGNREGYLINRADNPDSTWEEYQQFSTILKTFRALSESDITYLKSLPQQISISLNNKVHLRAVHGSPFSELDCIFESSVELINRSLGGITENILLCGHTHRPFVYTNDGKTLINAGSAIIIYLLRKLVIGMTRGFACV